MTILSFYSQNGECSVAIKKQQILYQETVLLTADRTQAQELIPLIQHVWKQADNSPFTTLMTARGPGAFTSLRVTLSVAQGFSLAFNQAQIFAPTHFDVLYYTAAQHTSNPVMALIDSKRGDWYGRIYPNTLTGAHPITIAETQVFDAVKLQKYLQENPAFKIIADFPLEESFTPYRIFHQDNLAVRQIELFQDPAFKFVWQNDRECQTFQPYYFYDPIYGKKKQINVSG